jgi:hypothetical protein
VGVDEGTHRKRKITMATLQYRGAEVTSQKAVVKPKTKTAIYRGVSYNPTKQKAAPVAKSGMYRGSSWEA